MASRFWVGGTGSWDAATTTHWSATSGGAGGASVPTSADDVFIDGNSGAGTVTLTATATVRSLDFTGFTGTFTHTGIVLSIAGPLFRLVTGMTYNPSSLNLNSPSGTTLLATTAGKTLSGVGIGGAGTVRLQDALTCSTINHTAGTFDTQSFSITCTSLTSSNSTTRTLTLGSSAITISGTGTVLALTTATGLTITANTATLSLTSGSITTSTPAAGINLNGASLVITGSSSQINVSAMTMANLTLNWTNTKFGNFTLTGDITVTGTVAFNGFSVTSRMLAQSNVSGTPRTITAGAVTGANADFTDIIGAGAASWDLSAMSGGSGDCQGNSGITFTPRMTLYRVNASSSPNAFSDATRWASTSGGVGGTGRIPLPQDDVVFDNGTSALNINVTIDMPRACRNIDWSGYTGAGSVSPPSPSIATTIYGNWVQGGVVFNATMGGNAVVFAGRGAQTLAFNNTFNVPVTINAAGGSYTLLSALTINATNFAVNSGTFDATGRTVTAATFASSTTVTRQIIGGNYVLTSTSATTVWSTSTTGLTVTGAPTITISAASANTRTLALSTFAYGTITYTVAASTGILAIGGSGSSFALASASGRTIQFGSNSTFGITGWTVTGATGSLVILSSSLAGTQARLQNLSGGSFASDYLSVKDIAGQDSTGTAAPSLWYVGGHSTNVSNNTGLTFSTALVLGQAVMSGSAQPVSAGRSTALYQATGASTAQPVSRTKQQAIGQATGASTAQPSHTAKARTLSVATGASIAQSAFRTKVRGVGAAAGASTGLSVAPSKAALLQAAVATSTSQPLRAVKQLVLTGAGETDIGLGAARIFLRDYELVLGDPLGDRLGFGVPTDRLAWAQADERPIFGQAGDRLVFGGSGV